MFETQLQSILTGIGFFLLFFHLVTYLFYAFFRIIQPDMTEAAILYLGKIAKWYKKSINVFLISGILLLLFSGMVIPILR